MTRAWYGISNTGGQAGATITKLISMAKDRFVDDLLGGSETREDVDKQIQGTTNILGRGGFSLKFSVHSGMKPCNKASSDVEDHQNAWIQVDY